MFGEMIGRRAIAALLTVSASLPQAAHGDDGIDTIVRRQMKISQLPGVAVAVVRRGRPIFVRAYGTANLEWKAKTTLDTRFQLASATKILTGIVLMRLVEQGQLTLDDPVTRWIPEAPPAWTAITVRRLADHTSGLSDDLGVEGPRTVASIVAAATAAPLAFAPGTQSRYGFTDFTVLRAVMERASGATFPELLRREVAAPLGLTSLGFADATEDGPVRFGAVIPRRASTYGLRDGEIVTADFFFEPAGYGAGGLHASIRDLAAIFAALDRGTLLTRESIRALELPAILSDGTSGGFGVGWVARTHRGVPVVGHSGGPALADIVRVEDRQLTIIVLTNQQTFFPLLATRILDRNLIAPAARPPSNDPRPDLARRLRAILSGQADKQDATLAAPLRTPFGQALLRGVGPLQNVEFLSTRSVRDCGTAIAYRAIFRWHQMVWNVKSACDGRVTDLSPE